MLPDLVAREGLVGEGAQRRRELDKYTAFYYAWDMDETPADLWIAACAHRLQQQWRTVDPLQLEEVAAELWRDERLRSLPPDAAAVVWLGPIRPTPF